MITPDDLEFHRADPTARLWTETTYVAFHVPEHGLHGTLYVMARPNMNVAMSSVVVAQGRTDRLHDVAFCDPQIHLPCPSSYSSFKLENGLAVEARSLTDWRFDYEHALGACQFSLDVSGLHHPYDPSDPQENPLKSPAAAGGDRLGDAWSHGHFDLKARVTGRLRLHGQEFDVDCFDGMDRSWGPRSETPQRATAYISANFGAHWSMWLTTLLSVDDSGAVVYEDVNSGFIVENGVVTPLVGARVSAVGANMLTLNDHIVVTDASGRHHELFGTAIGTRPLGSLNPSILAFQALMRYHRDGEIGYGGHGKLFGVNYLSTRRLNRSAL